jgi:hypothetical protein
VGRRLRPPARAWFDPIVSSPVDDPFAPPKTDPLEAATTVPDAERIRRQHFRHEASVRSVGVLYIFGASMIGLGSLSSFLSLDRGSIPVAATFLGVAGALGFVGSLVRRLDRRARIPVVILSAVGLLAFPIGTAINAYILWLFLSGKGSFVFSPEYKRIVRLTPYTVHRTSGAVIGLMVFIGLLIAIALFASLGSTL